MYLCYPSVGHHQCVDCLYHCCDLPSRREMIFKTSQPRLDSADHHLQWHKKGHPSSVLQVYFHGYFSVWSVLFCTYLVIEFSSSSSFFTIHMSLFTSLTDHIYLDTTCSNAQMLKYYNSFTIAEWIPSILGLEPIHQPSNLALPAKH